MSCRWPALLWPSFRSSSSSLRYSVISCGGRSQRAEGLIRLRELKKKAETFSGPAQCAPGLFLLFGLLHASPNRRHRYGRHRI